MEGWEEEKKDDSDDLEINPSPINKSTNCSPNKRFCFESPFNNM